LVSPLGPLDATTTGDGLVRYVFEVVAEFGRALRLRGSAVERLGANPRWTKEDLDGLQPHAG
jgi:hypothetical protein